MWSETVGNKIQFRNFGTPVCNMYSKIEIITYIKYYTHKNSKVYLYGTRLKRDVKKWETGGEQNTCPCDRQMCKMLYSPQFVVLDITTMWLLTDIEI